MTRVLIRCKLREFVAIESFLTHREREAVTTIYWATEDRTQIEILAKIAFPNLQDEITLRDGEQLSSDVRDLNALIGEIDEGSRVYTYSTFARYILTDVSFNLPEKYIVVSPFSEGSRDYDQDLTQAELDEIKSDLPIIILDQGSTTDTAFVKGAKDLRGQTSLLEAFEVVKGASGFIGAPSVLSVIASKVLDRSQLLIKGQQKNRTNLYFAPQVIDTFIKCDVSDHAKLLSTEPNSRQLIVNTVQGIGDIFWVYQKLAPYFNRISFNVLCTSFNSVQARAVKFCKMLPKVRDVSLVKVGGSTYSHLATNRFGLAKIFDQAIEFCLAKTQPDLGDQSLNSLQIGSDQLAVNYAVNKPLEIGVRLEDVDLGTAVRWFVDLGLPIRVPTEDYLCIFIAGAKADGLWTKTQWIKMIKLLAKKLNTKKLKFIGAEWDLKVQQKIQEKLSSEYEVINLVDQLSLADSIDVIRRSRFFLGYQSGLNIIAENYDVPQMMLYFDRLEPMMFTWCKPNSINTQFFAKTFSTPPKQIMEYLNEYI